MMQDFFHLYIIEFFLIFYSRSGPIGPNGNENRDMENESSPHNKITVTPKKNHSKIMENTIPWLNQLAVFVKFKYP